MDEEDDQTHPLDRDYSTPVATRPQTTTSSYPNLLRIGVIVFAAGFLAVLLGGILISNYPGNSWGETFGSFIHRSGMIFILAGAVLIILAYRWDQLTSIMRSTKIPAIRNNKHAYVALVFWNVVGFVAIALLFSLSRLGGSTSLTFLVFNAMVTITLGFMITLVVWHRGFVRAYAIGVLAALGINSFTGLFGLNAMYASNDGSLLFVGHLATIVVCGLVCGGYVCLLESARSRKNDDANSEAAD
jgi:hypothetical protein